jgi:hypothetical protein
MFSAPLLLVCFEVVTLVALSAWLGGSAFFLWVVVPNLERGLSKEESGRALRILAPRFDRWSTFAAIIVLPAIVCRALAFPEFRGTAVLIQSLLLIFCILLQFHRGQILDPAIRRAWDEGRPELVPVLEWRRRWLNGATLAIGLAVLVWFAVRPAPQSSGIEEFHPEQRAQYDLEFLRALTRKNKAPDSAPPATSKQPADSPDFQGPGLAP